MIISGEQFCHVGSNLLPTILFVFPNIDRGFIDHSVSICMVTVIIPTAISGKKEKLIQFLRKFFIAVLFLNFSAAFGLLNNFFYR